ncbi:MAG: type IV pili twitching motility protein PilT, partial [Candidatus Omnitrophota bacterium]
MTLESLLQKAAKQQASDVHLLANLPPFMRVDGELLELDKKPLAPKEIETLVKEIIDESRFKKFLLEKELDLAYEAKDGSRFRV